MLNETIQKEFQRKEIKYLIEADTFEQLQKEFKDYLTPDRFTHSSITNIYFDNPDFQLIKDSINHRHASEKIRMRTYDPKPTQKSQAFLEIKKKEYQVNKKSVINTVWHPPLCLFAIMFSKE